jgi:D-alanyl-D-alanine carboxypeptidase
MRRALAALVLAALAGCTSTTEAPSPSLAAAPPPPPPPLALIEPAPTVTPRAYAAIVIDARNGAVLHQTNATEARYPASLTKMMTLYLLFERFESGSLRQDSPLTVSVAAARQPPTKVGVRAGGTITADTAARAIAVHSANDAALVVAENIAGSEAAFAALMTDKARALGMTRTKFVNASGLPDPGQYTTARDMAVLGRALAARFPRYFGYFGTEEVVFNGRRWKNTNKLLGVVDGVNGIKTGYIRDAGYNLVASVERDGRRIIAVVIGGRSGTDRNNRMKELIETYLPEASGGGMVAMNVL